LIVKSHSTIRVPLLLADEFIDAVFSIFESAHASQSSLKLFGDRTGHLGVVASELSGCGMPIRDHHPVLTEGVEVDLDPDVF
jgi:hypothetical protein